MPPDTPHIPQPDGSLRELLDQAGRAAQPRHPGWDTLAARLSALPQRRRRRWLLPVAAAALLVAAAVLLFSNGPGRLREVQAEELPIRVERQDVELTVLSVADTAEEALYMPLVQWLAGEVVPNPNPMMREAQGLFWRDLAVGRHPVPVPPGPVVPQPLVLEDMTRFSGVTFGGPAGTGQALVKDHRLILNLKKGDNLVRFTDVPATIDPTSVRFVSNTDPASEVVEQNFEFDLASADKLLWRFVDKPITCIGRDGSETSGFLAAVDAATVVLADEPAPSAGAKVQRRTQTLTRAGLRALRLPEWPPDLLVKPTLVWKLRTQTPGRHDTTVSYLCGRVHWFADYVAVVQPGQGQEPDTIDLTGWVSLANNSGATYPDAGLKLIAGDVNRTRDPWSPIPPQDEMPRPMPAPPGLGGGGGGGPPVKEFKEKSFFEYHLYTLSAPSTVRNQQVKQLNLLQKRGIQAQRRYVYAPQVDEARVAVELTLKNEKDNQLGVPLPKGRVRLEQKDIDGDSALIGQVETDHTAVKEEMRLPYGYAYDVAGHWRTTSYVTHSPLHQTATYEVKVRSHKSEPIRARVVFRTGTAGKVTQASHPYVMHDFQTAHLDFNLAPDAEEVLTITVDYHHRQAPP